MQIIDRNNLGRGKQSIESWLAIAEVASDSEIFDALFKMTFYAEVKRWPNGLEVYKFRHEMATMSWSLQITNSTWTSGATGAEKSGHENGMGGD
ncbi:hypothetical protein niasHT_000859 [Heterodera trifolii]|uniref:Uncharacterized protein n=1 Tax=Heterodera trifolii TaxID=157864 RepID=A0ABD2MCI1_9BILA